MKVIIIKNMYPKLRIVNGTIGYVQNIIITKSHWIQKNHSMHLPTNVFVDLNESILKHDILRFVKKCNSDKT